MSTSIGMNIARLRKERNLTQSELAEQLNISAQAVSKWENDVAYPDITTLKPLAELLDTTVEELLNIEEKAETVFVPSEKRKNIDELVFKIRIVDGNDKVKINLPLSLLTVMKDTDNGTNFLQITGNNNVETLSNIDFDKLIQLAEKGVLGKLVEIENDDGPQVEIFVE